MEINKLIKELEKRYSKQSKSFYASIDDLANDIYKILIEVKYEQSNN